MNDIKKQEEHISDLSMDAMLIDSLMHTVRTPESRRSVQLLLAETRDRIIRERKQLKWMKEQSQKK